MPPLSDAELLARSDEDASAFAEVYRRHERAVVVVVGRMVRGDAELTVDVVAETFARAYEGRASFRGEGAGAGGDARAWLLGIARNVAFAAFRAGRVERDARERLGMEALALGEETRRAVEEAVLESDDAVVAQWLAELPADQREAIRRRVLEEGEYEAIAAELRTSPAVIRQRVSRGLGALRRRTTMTEEGR
jgi:RNA polymerase sigma factor (sigma-70 family)